MELAVHSTIRPLGERRWVPVYAEKIMRDLVRNGPHHGVTRSLVGVDIWAGKVYVHLTVRIDADAVPHRAAEVAAEAAAEAAIGQATAASGCIGIIPDDSAVD